MNCYTVLEEVTLRTDYPVSYGILYTPTSSNSEQPIRITDITVDYERICALVTLCNDLLLSPTHLAEIVDDFLAKH